MLKSVLNPGLAVQHDHGRQDEIHPVTASAGQKEKEVGESLTWRRHEDCGTSTLGFRAWQREPSRKTVRSTGLTSKHGDHACHPLVATAGILHPARLAQFSVLPRRLAHSLIARNAHGSSFERMPYKSSEGSLLICGVQAGCWQM